MKWKMSEPKNDTDDVKRWRIRLGGFDKRKLMFKGILELEEFEYEDVKGSFCLMNRDQVCVCDLNVRCYAEYVPLCSG